MSELVEKVAMAMWNTSDPSQWEKEMAGKAIAAVAEWLEAWHKAEYLQSENHASPALRSALEAAR